MDGHFLFNKANYKKKQNIRVSTMDGRNKMAEDSKWNKTKMKQNKIIMKVFIHLDMYVHTTDT